MGSCCYHVRSPHFFPSHRRNPTFTSPPSLPSCLLLNSGSASSRPPPHSPARFSLDYLPRSFSFSDGGGGGGGGSGGESGGGGRWWRYDGDNSRDDGGGRGRSAWETDSLLILLFVLSRALYSSETFNFFDGIGLLVAVSALSFFFELQVPSAALARTEDERKDDREGRGIAVWEVKGGKWTKLVRRVSQNGSGGDDEFVISGDSSQRLGWTRLGSLVEVRKLLKEVVVTLMLPEGFPESVTSDYLEYSLWRGVQGVASQISGVLATQVS